MARIGTPPRYSRVKQSGVLMSLGAGHRVVADRLRLKYALEVFHDRVDGKDRWRPVHSSTLRNDLLCHLLDEQLLDETSLAELVRRMTPYVGGVPR